MYTGVFLHYTVLELKWASHASVKYICRVCRYYFLLILLRYIKRPSLASIDTIAQQTGPNAEKQHAARCAVLLRDWLLELSALAQEQMVAVPSLEFKFPSSWRWPLFDGDMSKAGVEANPNIHILSVLSCLQFRWQPQCGTQEWILTHTCIFYNKCHLSTCWHWRVYKSWV